MDRFDDAACDRFIWMACGKFWISRFAFAGMGVVLCLFEFVVLLWLTNFVVNGVMFPDNNARPATDGWYVFCLMSGIALSGLLSFFTGMLIRDRWLHWAISTQVVAAKCFDCGYSLLGLEVRDGHVACPECGRRAELRERGLEPQDLLSIDSM